MPAYTVTDFVADQLRAQNPNADWNVQGIDRAQELARMLVRNDIVDLTKLRLKKVEFPVTRQVFASDRSSPNRGYEEIVVETTIETGIAFEYEGRTIGFMGTPDRADQTPAFENTLIAWSAEGHGNVGYDVTFSNQGFSIVPNWASSSDLTDIRQQARMIGSLAVSMVLPLAGINVAAMIGQAALGPIFGVVSPTIAAAVGQTALSTVFNGGDVEKAVRDVVVNLAASNVGARVGNYTSDLTESQLTGKLAAAATSAVVSGKDVPTSVGFALLRNGFPASGTTDTPTPAPEPSPTPPPEPVNVSAPVSAPVSTGVNQMEYADLIPDESGIVDLSSVPNLSLTGSFQWDSAIPALSPSLDVPAISTVGAFEWDAVAPELSPALDPVYSTTADIRSQLIAAEQQAAENPVEASDPWGNRFKDIVTNIGTFGAGVVAVIKTVDRVRNVVTNSRTTNPDGSTTVALDNGLVITKDRNGNVISAVRPPVGTGQTTATGNIVANLGDGTYSLTTPTGQRRVIKYDSALSSGSIMDTLAANPVPLLLAGAGILAAVIKSRGR